MPKEYNKDTKRERKFNPKKCKKGSFRTKKISKDTKAILCKKIGSNKMSLQSVVKKRKYRLVRMSIREYKKWMQNPNRLRASTKEFHKNGFKRTLNILKGDAKPDSIKKWESFKGRWERMINLYDTPKVKIAIKNWGYKYVKT